MKLAILDKFDPWEPPDNPNYLTVDQLVDKFVQGLKHEPMFDDSILNGHQLDVVDTAYYEDLYNKFLLSWDRTWIRQVDMRLAWQLLWIEFLTQDKVRLGYLITHKNNHKIRGDLIGVTQESVDGLLNFYTWIKLHDRRVKNPVRYNLSLVNIFPVSQFAVQFEPESATAQQLSLFEVTKE